MIIGSIVILLLSLFILFSAIGLFNKPVRKWMAVIRFYLTKLRANRKNFKKLPKTAKKFYPVLRHRRSLFKLKLLKNFHHHKKVRS